MDLVSLVNLVNLVNLVHRSSGRRPPEVPTQWPRANAIKAVEMKEAHDPHRVRRLAGAECTSPLIPRVVKTHHYQQGIDPETSTPGRGEIRRRKRPWGKKETAPARDRIVI